MNKLIIFMIRKKLGLKRKQKFKFLNQKNPCESYLFTDDCLVKLSPKGTYLREAKINLNFLLSEEAKDLIVKCEVLK